MVAAFDPAQPQLRRNLDGLRAVLEANQVREKLSLVPAAATGAQSKVSRHGCAPALGFRRRTSMVLLCCTCRWVPLGLHPAER